MTTAEARARMDRAFTMPQFVTSSAGYAGSARAKKVGARLLHSCRPPYPVSVCPCRSTWALWVPAFFLGKGVLVGVILLVCSTDAHAHIHRQGASVRCSRLARRASNRRPDRRNHPNRTKRGTVPSAHVLLLLFVDDRNDQVQRQGSFLSRSGSFHSRSGSLASGKTTVSASKFVFMSSVPGAAAGGAGADDNCARTGFEEPAARDVGAGKEGGEGWSTSRPPFSASGANSPAGKKAGAGAFSGISALKKGKGVGNPGGGGDKGRLWKGLCASGKQKARR